MNKKNFWSLLTFMMVAVLSVGFASCSSDDDESSDSLSGKWEAHSDEKEYNKESVGTHTFTFKNGKVTYEEKWSEPGYEDDVETYTGSYIIEGEIITMELSRIDGDYDENYVWVFEWEVKDNQLTLKADNRDTANYWPIRLYFKKK